MRSLIIFMLFLNTNFSFANGSNLESSIIEKCEEGLTYAYITATERFCIESAKLMIAKGEEVAMNTCSTLSGANPSHTETMDSDVLAESLRNYDRCILGIMIGKNLEK